MKSGQESTWFAQEFTSTEALWKVRAFSKTERGQEQKVLLRASKRTDHKSGKPLKTLTIGDEEVNLIQDTLWSKIRHQFEIRDDFISNKNFSFTDLQEGGGKGGSLMAFTRNKLFIVKELSDGDHNTLLKLSKVLVDHLLKEDSIMARFFAHFERSSGQKYVVMNSVLPRIKGLKWTYMFDLKGNRDDKLMIKAGQPVEAIHNRCWNICSCWFGCNGACECLTTDERQEYYSGKLFAFSTIFTVSPSQREEILRRMDKDIKCLRDKMETMDYSLLLSVLEIPFSKFENGLSEAETIALATSRYICISDEGRSKKVVAYFFGIIDFLQEWTTTKKIARCIKAFAPKPLSTVPPPLYAEQFYGSFSDKFQGDGKKFMLPEIVDLDNKDKELCKEFLNTLDKDNNGTIEISEAMQLLPKVLRPDLFLQSLDKNKDQKISMDEVFTWYKGIKQRENENKDLGKSLLHAIIQLTKKEMTAHSFSDFVSTLDRRESLKNSKRQEMKEDKKEDNKVELDKKISTGTEEDCVD
mmetsp:Transcript_7193/g.10952  ORF Transcript_7193/g.10952 Transcript_7193/m.10952 type:complete len:525 (+) Transcript_7193:67-1641(+)|eukprot:CAMPEP_0167761572 /NCGR_PEP_ID=MMETSP0110_2-20121227/12251_1 /TAXON_ID=629695 /ORGANISM="Gymnochlora sp., Strain CCMP2014" /LENGTH=524 /DNA_ID=CAMNT_0007648279 /DNA_START=37 /DNA_END=1611 /DNA_ORIENTATION=-